MNLMCKFFAHQAIGKDTSALAIPNKSVLNKLLKLVGLLQMGNGFARYVMAALNFAYSKLVSCILDWKPDAHICHTCGNIYRRILADYIEYNWSDRKFLYRYVHYRVGFYIAKQYRQWPMEFHPSRILGADHRHKRGGRRFINGNIRVPAFTGAITGC
jgi:hypothetical protein